jgi:hypothetical protein
MNFRENEANKEAVCPVILSQSYMYRIARKQNSSQTLNQGQIVVA